MKNLDEIIAVSKIVLQNQKTQINLFKSTWVINKKLIIFYAREYNHMPSIFTHKSE